VTKPTELSENQHPGHHAPGTWPLARGKGPPKQRPFPAPSGITVDREGIDADRFPALRGATSQWLASRRAWTTARLDDFTGVDPIDPARDQIACPAPAVPFAPREDEQNVL
jgi:hypothetical protein